MLKFLVKLLASLGLIWRKVSPEAKLKVQKTLTESLALAYSKAQQLKSKAQEVWDHARRPSAAEVQSQIPKTEMSGSVSKILQQDLSAKEADHVAVEIEKYVSSLEFAEEVEEHIEPAIACEDEKAFNERVRKAVEKVLSEKMKEH